jgi:EAL domain-containing protein (putative c-di-GMP-specific phosphodiesterase class I)
LFRNAMTALALVPPSDPRPCRRYDAAMTRLATRRLSLQQQLRRAIDNDELDVFYEPQVDTRRPLVVGAEALLRWPRGPLGAVAPTEFIPLAETSGLILPLGDLVLRKVCRQLRVWKTARRIGFPIAVNLSREQLRSRAFSRHVLAILSEEGIEPKELVLELTESVILQNVDTVRQLMVELTECGTSFAIDDFGVEHSALSYLVDLPVQTIKIDRAFVAPMTEDERFAAIVHAIISMSRIMGKRTIAEGVETEDQRVYLRAYGCEAAQGYLFSGALPAAEFADFLERFPGPPSRQ